MKIELEFHSIDDCLPANEREVAVILENKGVEDTGKQKIASGYFARGTFWTGDEGLEWKEGFRGDYKEEKGWRFNWKIIAWRYQ